MKALIVDDDRTLADLLAFTLRRAGFEPTLAYDAPGAVKKVEQDTFDVIVLDVNLPGTSSLPNGFAVCSAIRQFSDTPIILLTVRDDEEDILHGLEIGADDYIFKPFSPRQLVARIQAVVRRSASGKSAGAAPLTYLDFEFDLSRREVSREGHTPIKLTRLEAQLLEYLMLNAHYILPAEDIIAHVWGPGAGSTEMLRQLVRRLRTKIEDDPANPQFIVNLAGTGYGMGVKN